MPSTLHTAKVAVVGAGLAGITAALRLAEKGLDVVVLEARDRVGGRVFSVENERGLTVDLGSQWIGPSMRRMHRLIDEEGLTKVKTPHRGKTIYAAGGRVRYGYSSSPPLAPLFLLDRLNMLLALNKRFKRIDPGAPWLSVNGRLEDRESVGSFIEKQAYTRWGQAYWRVMLGEALCKEVAEVSLLDYMWALRSNGSIGNTMAAENEWIQEGAYALVEKLSQRLGPRIKLQTPVREIRYDGRQVMIRTDRGEWQADRVIVAVPPVLAGRIEYFPPMPVRRAELTHNLQPGRIIKCAAAYARPFWRDSGYSGIGYYDEGPVRATMDGSLPGRPEGMLIALVSGRGADELGQLHPEQRRAVVFEWLGRWFGSRARDALAYTDKDWTADEWSLGGYGGHFAPGSLVEYAPALYEPVGPIHWAGSETATEYRLYMEGAVQSGERAADEVLRHFVQ